ncbi:MAG: hypothetical protein MHM6MM_003249 [Cercozoa sp. M6MM]
MVRVVLACVTLAAAFQSVLASADPLIRHLRDEFDPNARGLHILFARHAEGEHNAQVMQMSGLVGSDHPLTDKGKRQARDLGMRWCKAAFQLVGPSRTCEDLARAFFGRFDAIHVSAQRRTLQTLDFALEQFAQEMSDSGICGGLAEAETAIAAVFAEREFRVMLRIRESLTTQSANVGQSSLYNSLTQLGARGVLLRLVTEAAMSDPDDFVKQLMRIEAPGRQHIDGLHKYAEHLELEDIPDRQQRVDAILRKPLVEFESSQMQGHIKPEHVSHTEARALGYIRRLLSKQEQLGVPNYRVLVVSHGAFFRALAAPQLALSLHDTANLPAASGEFKFPGAPNEEALKQHMEVARYLGSDLGVQGAASGYETEFKPIVHMSNCDMFVVSNPVGDIVPATQRPFMFKLPAKQPDTEVGVPRDHDPVAHGRSATQCVGKMCMVGLNIAGTTAATLGGWLHGVGSRASTPSPPVATAEYTDVSTAGTAAPQATPLVPPSTSSAD